MMFEDVHDQVIALEPQPWKATSGGSSHQENQKILLQKNSSILNSVSQASFITVLEFAKELQQEIPESEDAEESSWLSYSESDSKYSPDSSKINLHYCRRQRTRSSSAFTPYPQSLKSQLKTYSSMDVQKGSIGILESQTKTRSETQETKG